MPSSSTQALALVIVPADCLVSAQISATLLWLALRRPSRLRCLCMRSILWKNLSCCDNLCMRDISRCVPSIVIYVKIFFVKVVRDMKEYMETKGACNQCTKYLMRSVETKTALKVDELDVGFWTPAGPYLKDDLLPNVKGHFRGRTIPIGSVHVGFIVNFHLIIFVNISILLGKCSKKTEKEKLLVPQESSLRFWIKLAIK